MLRPALHLLVGLATAFGFAFASAFAEPPAPKARIDSGALVGTWLDGARAFKAIPYAAAPLGPLRWRPPQPAPRWRGE